MAYNSSLKTFWIATPQPLMLFNFKRCSALMQQPGACRGLVMPGVSAGLYAPYWILF